MSTQYSLREQRKRKTRAALIDAATDLFAEQGVDDTTLEEVAQRAGLHVQTLFRHFPSKAALANELELDYLKRFKARFEDPARTDDTFTFWRAWVAECASQQMGTDGGKRLRRKLEIRDTMPVVYGNVIETWYQYEELLTLGLARDFGLDPEKDPLPRLVACMLWGGNVNASRRWVRRPHENENFCEACVAVVDDVYALFSDRLQRLSKLAVKKR